MAHAATLGGMAYGTESAGAAHAMSQSAGGVHDCPHGALTARVLGPVMEYNAPADPVRHARIAQGLGVDTSGLSALEAALAGVEELYRLTDDVGIPAMEELGFSEDEIPMLARIAFEDPQTTGNAREVDVEAYEGIYRNAFARGKPMSVATRDYSMVIGGEWADSEGGGRLEATSPASGESLGTVPEGTRDDAGRAIASANAAWRGWAAASAFERAAALGRVADLIEERRDDLADTLTLDQGKPLHAEAYGEVEELVVYWRMAAADATRLGGSMPPSVDACQAHPGLPCPARRRRRHHALELALHDAGRADRARARRRQCRRLGSCSVDLDVLGQARRVHRRRRAPGGRVLDGDRARSPSSATRSHRIQACTASGSSAPFATGLHVAARAAGKTTLLELGGNGPMVVLDDADVTAAAEASIVASFLCAGQSCTAGERYLVHEAVYDEFVERLRGRGRERGPDSAIRSPRTTTMGPLNNEATAQKMDEHVADAARSRCASSSSAGSRATGFQTDLYWQATVLTDVTEEMDVAREETFGPVDPDHARRERRRGRSGSRMRRPTGCSPQCGRGISLAGSASPKLSTRAG